MARTPTPIVILDNASSIHHVDQVVELITSVRALVRFLPPYSPDMNPIKELFTEQYLQANHSLYLANTSMSSVSIYLANGFQLS